MKEETKIETAKPETEVAVINEVPEWLKDEKAETMESLGLEQKDVVFNHVLLLQAMSPQLQEDEFVTARQGDIINTSGINYGGEFTFVVLKIWTDRLYKDKKTGVVCFSANGKTGGSVAPTCATCPNAQFGSSVNGRGVLCPERRSYLVIPCDKTTGNFIDDPAIMRLKSTKTKAAKKLNSMILTANVPMTSRMFTVKAVKGVTNGDTYFTFDVVSAGFASKISFLVAKDMAESIKGAKMVMADAEDDHTPTGTQVVEVDGDDTPVRSGIDLDEIEV